MRLKLLSNSCFDLKPHNAQILFTEVGSFEVKDLAKETA
jgi:hypothetical protein|tara:strand:- start:503 stop:619 length:117 start_codon:yes stop_codon:yes gene_type:complete